MGRQRKPKLTIIEGKWFPKFNVSIHEVMRPLSAVWPHKTATKGSEASRADPYYYEMFTTGQALAAALEYAFMQGRPDIIYVAAHGDQRSLQGFHRSEVVSRTVVKNAITGIFGTTRRGILFGACHFGTERNAKAFLKANPRLAWVAGYTSEVDWVESTLLDMFFLYHLLYPQKPGLTLVTRAKYAALMVSKQMFGLADALKFHVYIREQGRGKTTIRDLVGVT